ncbi:MAG: YIP1 family protein [Oligoflexia bacterium]|nr:YIP1 family protein [Oligoflexia bacterium]
MSQEAQNLSTSQGQNGSCCSGQACAKNVAQVIQRAKSIILNPVSAWETIKAEQSQIADVYKNYLCYLAAVPAIAMFIGIAIIGVNVPFLGTYRAPFFSSLIAQVVSYGVTLAMVYAVAMILEFLAPKFGGAVDRTSAVKLVAYSLTPAMAAGIFAIMPWLGFFVLAAASLYSIYVFYAGVSVMTSVPAERRVGFIAVSALATFVLGLIVTTIQAILTPQPPTPTADAKEIEESMRHLFEKALQGGMK